MPEIRARFSDMRSIVGVRLDNTILAGRAGFSRAPISHELDTAEREPQHSQQQPPVLPAPDVGGSIRALQVADRKIDNLQVLLGRAKQQVEVAKRIEVAEVRAVRTDRFVLLLAQHLDAA